MTGRVCCYDTFDYSGRSGLIPLPELTPNNEPPVKITNVLILCTGNSARSILAESLCNDPEINGGKLRGFSAGSQPKDAPNPFALELLRSQGARVEGLRSKNWDEFSQAGAPQMDIVITVCDQAAGKPCPLWPGAPLTAHWGISDPASIEGSVADKQRAFFQAYETLRRSINKLAELPLDQLSAKSIGEKLSLIAPPRVQEQRGPRPVCMGKKIEPD